jgi:hypothetical protein
MAEDKESRLFLSPIADPIASDKMSKKIMKLIKKGMKDKLVKRGVKETVKAVRKGNKGYSIFFHLIDQFIVFALLQQISLLLMCSLTYQFFVKKIMLHISMSKVELKLVMHAKQRDLHHVYSSKHQPKKAILKRNLENLIQALDREINTSFDLPM